jgi:hypothetical protein
MSFHPQGLDDIHFRRSPGGNETCDQGSYHHDGPPLNQAPERDGELNRPSERLFVDHIDEKEGKEETTKEAENETEEAYHPCFN